MVVVVVDTAQVVAVDIGQVVVVGVMRNTQVAGVAEACVYQRSSQRIQVLLGWKRDEVETVVVAFVSSPFVVVVEESVDQGNVNWRAPTILCPQGS